MSIYAEMVNLTNGTSSCKMAKLLDSAPETDRTDIENALANIDISTNAIHVVLNKHGFKIGYTSLQRHRQKECACVFS